ncbi:MAG: hypothetical protein E7040_08865 [Lentisphaerae bacterium]|nr:hypothetical protein [Lentisphaerota bacterium]
MLKSLFLLATGALLSIGCAAPKELVVDQENPKNWSGKVEYSREHARNNGPCFVLYGGYPTPLIYNKMFRIDPAKTYIFKAKFRSLDAALPASAYMGFELFDAQKRRMQYFHVVTVDLKYSEVVSAKKGDKFMIVKMISDFQKIKNKRAAFNAKEDFSDIPNMDLAPTCSKVEKTTDGNVRMELKSVLKKDYPAGTKIRFHAPYGPPMYYLTSGWMPAGEGKECTVVLSGISDKPGATSKQFWKGAVYARPFIWFGNWNRIPKKGAKLLVDGFSLVETDKAPAAVKK